MSSEEFSGSIRLLRYVVEEALFVSFDTVWTLTKDDGQGRFGIDASIELHAFKL